MTVPPPAPAPATGTRAAVRPGGPDNSLVVIGGAGGLVAYVLAARWLKIGELRDLTAMLRGRLPGRAGWQAR